jgi:hypothetical protein
MVLTDTADQRLQILNYIATICKPSLKNEIVLKLQSIWSEQEILEFYEYAVKKIMGNTYLFFPSVDRTIFYKVLLTCGMEISISFSGQLGGTVNLKPSRFAYQFIRGRNDMKEILKALAIEKVRTEYVQEIAMQSYRAIYTKKRIEIDFTYLDPEYAALEDEFVDIEI